MKYTKKAVLFYLLLLARHHWGGILTAIQLFKRQKNIIALLTVVKPVHWIAILREDMTPAIFIWSTIASIISALLVLWLSSWRRKQKDKKKFENLKGEYDGYEFEGDGNKVGNWTLSEVPVSSAKIFYVNSNHLLIRLDHDSKTWSGEIYMADENSGTVSYRYEKGTDGEHRFGFKRVIVRRESKNTFVYLVGESPHGREVLKKK